MNSVTQYITFLRENMSIHYEEAKRRATLAKDYIAKNPPSKSMMRKKLEAQVAAAFLMGYDQACRDLLTPKDTPGQPATAVLLLNRVGEMVLKTRRELLAIYPRVQCPGCFCLLAKEDEKLGWCPKCHEHSERLIAQTQEELQPTQNEGTVGAGTQEGGSDAA